MGDRRMRCRSLAREIPELYWGRIMPGGRPPAFNPFTCPNCGAFYQVVKAEAGPETDTREITCRACGGPLTGRDGKFVLKYFLLRKRPRVSAPSLTRRKPQPALLSWGLSG
jgi:hypothetical protein